MLKAINGYLQKYFGVRFIHFGLSYFRRTKLYKTKPLYIEFYGASGVGKSTLFKSVETNNKNQWLSLKSFKSIYLRLLDKKSLESHQVYQFLAEDKIEEVLENSSFGLPSIKMKKLMFYYTALIDDILIRLYNKNHTVISEEGIMQIYTNSMIKLFLENKNSFQNLLENRAIVYCYSSAEIIAQQILNRADETGNLREEHETSSINELINKIDLELEQKNILIEILKEFEVPILYINTRSNSNDNIRKINDFINKLQKDNFGENK